MALTLPPPGTVTIVSSDRGHVVALYNPLILACFTRQATPAELALIEEAAAKGVSQGIRGGMLYVVARKSIEGGIDANSRATFERMTRKNSASSGASAVVIQVEGFSGALIRGFLAGLVQLTRRRQTLEVCATVEQACSRLALDHELDPIALRRVCRQVMGHLEVGTAPPPAP